MSVTVLGPWLGASPAEGRGKFARPSSSVAAAHGSTLDATGRPPPHPRVSVIVPAYNAAWWVRRLLESVAAQSMPDFECVVVDDGSTDDTAVIVEAFCASDSRFRCIRQQNLGVAEARNRALGAARGEFVAPVDADDLWHRDYLLEMTRALDSATGAKAPFAFCYSHWIDADDFYESSPGPARPPRGDFIGLLRQNAVGNGSCAVFRRSALVGVGGYDISLKDRGAQGGDDWKALLLVAARGDALVVPLFLVGYRRTPNSLSADALGQARSSLIVLSDIRRLFPRVARRHFWAARTDFLVWLLPIMVRKRNIRSVIRYGAMAYVANPLWPTQPQARMFWSLLAARLLRRAHAGPATPRLLFGDHDPGARQG